MEANFNPESDDSGLADLVVGVVIIAGVAGLAWMGYKKSTEEEPSKRTTTKAPANTAPKNPPPPERIQVSTQVALSKAPKDTVLWLQKYLNRQVIAPKVGTKLNEETTVKFIEENGIWSVADNSPFLIGLWLFYQKYGKEGLDLSYELGEAATLKFLFDYVGLDVVEAIQDPKNIQGSLAASTKTQQNTPVYSLPDVDAKLLDAKPSTIIWVQKFLNLMTAAEGKPLTIDGKLGKATKAKLAGYLSKNHQIFAIDYSPQSNAENNFLNYSLRQLMGSTGTAKQYFSVAL